MQTPRVGAASSIQGPLLDPETAREPRINVRESMDAVRKPISLSHPVHRGTPMTFRRKVCRRACAWIAAADSLPDRFEIAVL